METIILTVSPKENPIRFQPLLSHFDFSHQFSHMFGPSIQKLPANLRLEKLAPQKVSSAKIMKIEKWT